MLALLAASIDLVPPGTPSVTAQELIPTFDPARVPPEPWVLTADVLG